MRYIIDEFADKYELQIENSMLNELGVHGSYAEVVQWILSDAGLIRNNRGK